MQYPKMGGTRSYSVKVPKLSGGINKYESPHLVEDNQLTDARNMWWKDGALRSRDGLWTGEDELGNAYMNASVEIEPTSIKYSDLDGLSFVEVDGVINPEPGIIIPAIQRFSFYNGGYFHKSTGENVSFVASMYAKANGLSEITPSDFGAIAFSSYPASVWAADSGNYTDLSSYIHIPTILKDGVPSLTTENAAASGNMYEAKNMLTPKFKAQYVTDSKGIYYHLPLKGLDNTEIVISRVDSSGATYTWTIPAGANASDNVSYRANVNRVGGYVWFTNSVGDIHPMTSANIKNNLTITASKTVNGASETICGMTFNTWYGSDRGISGGTRLIVSGNPDYPNLVHFSDVNNPLYFPDTNRLFVGGDSQKVTGFGKQSNMLVIFKEREMYYAHDVTTEITAEQVMDGLSPTTNTLFTITPINAYIGCDIPDTIQLCANRLVWMNTDGKVYTLVSANQFNEQNVREVSQNIEAKLLLHDTDEFRNASSADYDGHYYLLISNKVYVMDYRNGSFQYYASYTNDEKVQKSIGWYEWDVGIGGVTWNRIIGNGTQPVMCGSYVDENYNTILINYVFSYKSGYNDYTPDGNLGPISCMFQTKVFDFDNPSTMKNISEVFLGVGREMTQPVLKVTYLTNRGESVDAYELQSMLGAADSNTAEYIDIRRITPRLNRILRFGLRVASDTAMAVDSIEVKYSLFNGGVR